MFSKEEDLGILETTNDALLGENVQIDATNENAIQLPSSEEVQGFFAKIWNAITNFFDGLFNKDKEVVEPVEKEDVLFENNTDADFEIKTEEESQVDIKEDVNSENVIEENTETNVNESTENVVDEESQTTEDSVVDNVPSSEDSSNTEN